MSPEGTSYHWVDERKLASDIVDGWMESPGHRDSILSGYHSAGIGMVITPEGKAYVTQNFC